MRVLILTNNVLGLFAFRKELILKLLSDGNSVSVAGKYCEKTGFFQSHGCKMIETNIDSKSVNPLKELKLFRKYKLIIKEENPDIVLTYTVKPNIYGGLICKKNKIPCISNVTGLSASIVKGGFFSKLLLFLYKRAIEENKCVFFQNQSNLDFFKSLNIVNDNSKLLPGSGVNLKEFDFINYPDDNNKISFLFVGRICKDKGFDEFAECARYITSRYDNVTFDAIGEIEDKNLNKLIKQCVNDGVINYYGLRFDVKSFYGSHHAVVLPSYHEGMSNVLLESLACGRPVIASDIHGCKETFDDGISGFSFKAKSTSDLIEKVEKFINLPYSSKVKMGVEGRKKVENEFDREIVIREYYKEIFRQNLYVL